MERTPGPMTRNPSPRTALTFSAFALMAIVISTLPTVVSAIDFGVAGDKVGEPTISSQSMSIKHEKLTIQIEPSSSGRDHMGFAYPICHAIIDATYQISNDG